MQGFLMSAISASQLNSAHCASEVHFVVNTAHLTHISLTIGIHVHIVLVYGIASQCNCSRTQTDLFFGIDISVKLNCSDY